MDAVHNTLGCPAGPAGVNCAIAAGANIESYAANGLGRAEAASPSNANPFAFPGLNPDFNAMNTLRDAGAFHLQRPAGRAAGTPARSQRGGQGLEHCGLLLSGAV